MEFQVRYLALFHLFLVIDGFREFWMGSRHKNIQLMLEVLKALFLVQHFSYNTLMTFLILLSVISLSMLMILLTTLIVIRHLISSNKWNWLLASNLIYETLDKGKKWSFDFNAGVNELVSFDWYNSTGAIKKNGWFCS